MKSLKKIKNGLLIIFDGIDGTGKTTQLKLVEDNLKKAGYLVETSRNLGGSLIGEELRKVLLSPTPRPPLTDLYVGVAIQEALIEQINKFRLSGSIILLDRGPLSLVAYQAYGSGLDKRLSWGYTDQAMKALNPDLIIIYKADIATALKRARAVSGSSDYFESKPLDFFQRVEVGFSDGSKKYKAEVIDANASIEKVNLDTTKLVDQKISKSV